jgi:hypothetical protein
MRSKPSQHVFLIIDLAKWAPRITKTLICNIDIYGTARQIRGIFVGLRQPYLSHPASLRQEKSGTTRSAQTRRKIPWFWIFD